ncbi:MAG: HPr(Ser) kinase/phosphatase [Thermoanaerobaculia bacterium]|nr:HPr(Ser) kinase/phosphatase [Thermoanaerobaculia bacterium]
MTQAPVHVAVGELLGGELTDLQFRVLAGEEYLDRQILNPRVQKPGLAFAGYYEYIKPGRVQIIGESETEFLRRLPDEVRSRRFADITDLDIPVFIITKGLDAFPEFLELSRQKAIPVLSSRALSSTIIQRVSYFLEEHLVPSTTLHGVLLEIYGLGVLLIGASGVGKSESALDLVTRGHSLVADDRVTVRRYPNGDLVGSSDDLARHHMELRGIGIVNVQDLFGLAAVRDRKKMDLVVELEHWDESFDYDRLGLDESTYTILETPCAYVKMPVAPGRNVAILLEIAARNHLLKMQGHHSAKEFVDRLSERLEERRARPSEDEEETVDDEAGVGGDSS